jgi:hypothetical protein
MKKDESSNKFRLIAISPYNRLNHGTNQLMFQTTNLKGHKLGREVLLCCNPPNPNIHGMRISPNVV